MERTKAFIRYLCKIDLSLSPNVLASDVYDELETSDIDLEEKQIKKNPILPPHVKVKLLKLINFCYLNASDCINHYSDQERYQFLQYLKTNAEEIDEYLKD